MGHLGDKYDAAYFLGGVDAETGRRYGVRGHAAFAAGGVDPAHEREFEFVRTLADGFSGKAVLDIGCGRGDVIPLLLAGGCRRYLGLDFSAAALQIARQRAVDPRVDFRLGEAADLQMPGEFDVVTALDVVEHIPPWEMDAACAAIRRALAPGGVFVASTPIFENPNGPDHSDENPSVMGMHCNKQTWGTLAAACGRHGLLVVAYETGRPGLFGAATDSDVERSPVLKRRHTACLEAFRTGAAAATQPGGGDVMARVGRLAVVTTVPPDDAGLDRALRLVQSLRWHGGAVAAANTFVCVVGECPPRSRERLERYGAIVREISPPHPPRAITPIDTLARPELAVYDTVVMLDPDAVVIADPTPHLDGTVLQARVGGVAEAAGHGALVVPGPLRGRILDAARPHLGAGWQGVAAAAAGAGLPCSPLPAALDARADARWSGASLPAVIAVGDPSAIRDPAVRDRLAAIEHRRLRDGIGP
jgi:SAM-dependent methyltransferase